jgi:hypothetical protein
MPETKLLREGLLTGEAPCATRRLSGLRRCWPVQTQLLVQLSLQTDFPKLNLPVSVSHVHCSVTEPTMEVESSIRQSSGLRNPEAQ